MVAELGRVSEVVEALSGNHLFKSYECTLNKFLCMSLFTTITVKFPLNSTLVGRYCIRVLECFLTRSDDSQASVLTLIFNVLIILVLYVKFMT